MRKEEANELRQKLMVAMGEKPDVQCDEVVKWDGTDLYVVDVYKWRDNVLKSEKRAVTEEIADRLARG